MPNRRAYQQFGATVGLNATVQVVPLRADAYFVVTTINIDPGGGAGGVIFLEDTVGVRTPLRVSNAAFPITAPGGEDAPLFIGLVNRAIRARGVGNADTEVLVVGYWEPVP